MTMQIGRPKYDPYIVLTDQCTLLLHNCLIRIDNSPKKNAAKIVKEMPIIIWVDSLNITVLVLIGCNSLKFDTFIVWLIFEIFIWLLSSNKILGLEINVTPNIVNIFLKNKMIKTIEFLKFLNQKLNV